MSLYQSTIPQFKNTLTQMLAWLELAAAHAKEKNFDPSVLLTARLYPDQYPLIRQIQSACDSAKSTAARLAGQEPPKHPDTETTLEEIRTRVQTVLTFLDTVAAKDIAGADERDIVLPFLGGKSLKGTDYVNQLQLPNFYFHATTVYAILRHNGVPLGKTVFIGHLTLH